MPSSNLTKVFVYGTLKRGQPNNHWLTNPTNGISTFISLGKTRQLYPLVIGTRFNLPMLLNKKGVGNHIHGEIYEVDKDLFSKLDELEQYPNYYDREIQEIITENGTIVECWMYLIRDYSESMLSRKMLTSYSNSEEYPYCESYTDFEEATLF